MELAVATARLLSSETRVRLLRLLRVRPGARALCVNALARRLGVTQEAVSQHLRRFDELGLVRSVSRGVRTHYYLDEEQLERCLAALREALVAADDGGDECVARDNGSPDGCQWKGGRRLAIGEETRRATAGSATAAPPPAASSPHCGSCAASGAPMA